MLSNKHTDALKSNALSMALVVPQTVQGITGHELSLHGSVAAAKMQLIESLCRQCRDEVAVATRGQQPAQPAVSSWQRVKNVCASGQEAVGSLSSKVAATGSSLKATNVSAAASGAYTGIAHIGRGIVSIPSKIRSQVAHDAQLTKGLLVGAKNWVTSHKHTDEGSKARLLFDKDVAMATGEQTDTDNCSVVSDVDFDNLVADATE